MRDYTWILDCIRRGLLCIPIAASPMVLSGSVESAQPNPEPVTGQAVTPPKPKIKPPARRPRRSRCPSGTYATTVKKAKTMARKGAKLVMGCPDRLDPAKVPSQGRWRSRYSLDRSVTKAARDKGDPKTCAYRWYTRCPGGRALLDGGEVVVASATAGDAWRWAKVAGLALVDGLNADDRRALAQAWLGDAKSEHASIASFARAGMELMAVGAPPELIADVHRAGLDEIRHAQIAFSLASIYGEEDLSAGPLPMVASRPCDLISVAVNTFIEGCIGESVAALAVFRGAQSCRFDPLREVLEGIAQDEANHAALAWRTVKWAVATGGAPVIDALQGAASRHRPDPAPRVATRKHHDTLAAHGRLTPQELTDAAEDAWRGLIDPTLAELIGGTAT